MNAGYAAEAARLADALDDAQRAVLHKNLEALAALPPTLAGVQDALTKLRAGVDAFPVGTSKAKKSGHSPGQQAMLYAGMCVVHGVVARAADAAAAAGIPAAAALLEATLENDGVDAHDRTLLSQELQLAFGRELYVSALEARAQRT